MTKQGISAAESTTQLQALMTAFIKPSTDMTEALNEMGYASGSALIEAEGLTGALKFLQESTGGNVEELAKLLPNVRALKGAIALTGKQTDVYTESLDAMENSTGATNEAFKKQELNSLTLRGEKAVSLPEPTERLIQSLLCWFCCSCRCLRRCRCLASCKE